MKHSQDLQLMSMPERRRTPFEGAAAVAQQRDSSISLFDVVQQNFDIDEANKDYWFEVKKKKSICSIPLSEFLEQWQKPLSYPGHRPEVEEEKEEKKVEMADLIDTKKVEVKIANKTIFIEDFSNGLQNSSSQCSSSSSE